MSQQIQTLTQRLILVLLLGGALYALPAGAADAGPRTQALLRQLDSPRGICALPGDREARQAIELARASELMVYVQLDDAGDVVAARRAAETAGLLNRRVYVEQGSADRLHLADNLADLVVLLGDTLGRVSAAPCWPSIRPARRSCGSIEKPSRWTRAPCA